MFKHKPTAIDGRVVLAPPPVTVDPLVLATPATLFHMKVIWLVVEVHHSLTTVAPNDRQVAALYINMNSNSEAVRQNKFNRHRESG